MPTITSLKGGHYDQFISFDQNENIEKVGGGGGVTQRTNIYMHNKVHMQQASLSLPPLSLLFVTDDYMYLFNLSLPSYFQEIFQVQYKKPDGTSLTQTKVTDFVSLLFLKLWILECWSISYYLDIYPTIIPKIYLILIVDIEIIFLKE